MSRAHLDAAVLVAVLVAAGVIALFVATLVGGTGP